jgi:hypothetical protein
VSLVLLPFGDGKTSPISCVEIDYPLIQFKIMLHLIQRFHIQIKEICLQMNGQLSTIYAEKIRKEINPQANSLVNYIASFVARVLDD